MLSIVLIMIIIMFPFAAKFSRTLLHSQNSRKLRNTKISAHKVVIKAALGLLQTIFNNCNIPLFTLSKLLFKYYIIYDYVYI